ncbi:MAG: phosphoribosylformylglycinamidine synthase subunit PurS [Ignavibacteria bacterium]|nr:phosphoribosylformylglycinamidine synthase subunit PurS [Ignavibacteria bacterium]
MKKFNAIITITLRKGILDVQGKTVEHALQATDFPMISQLRIGKYVELTVQAKDSDAAEAIVEKACSKLIANPIMEDYSIEILEPLWENS